MSARVSRPAHHRFMQLAMQASHLLGSLLLASPALVEAPQTEQVVADSVATGPSRGAPFLVALDAPDSSLAESELRLRLLRPDLQPRRWHYRTLLAIRSLDGASRSTERAGVHGAETSVSCERIALIKAAISELDTAEVETNTPQARAAVRALHGQILEAWGFPLDAYAWYRSALGDDPRSVQARSGLERVIHRLSSAGR